MILVVRWVLLVALVTTTAACSTDDAEKCVTTNDAARQGLINRMQQTANALPWSATLTKQLPGEPTAILSPSPVPNNTNDADPEQSYSWSYPLWVLLPTGVTAARAVEALADEWRSREYSVTKRASGDVQAEDKDGYVYVTRTSVQDDLSVVLESPCFPKSQLDERASWPEQVAATG